MNPLIKTCLALAGVGSLALVGCNSSPSSSESTDRTTDANAMNVVTYVCADHASIEAQYPTDNADQVTVTLPNQDPVILPRVESASGAKYSDGSLTFWEKGGEAMVESDGQSLYGGCMEQ